MKIVPSREHVNHQSGFSRTLRFWSTKNTTTTCGQFTQTRPGVLIFTLLGVLIFSGCTHWDTRKTVVSEREVERRSTGGAFLQDRSSSQASISGWSDTEKNRYRSTTDVAGGFSSDSVREIRCVEPYEITYDRTYSDEADLKLRWLDLTGGAVWGFLGAGTLIAGITEHNRTSEDSTFERESNSTVMFAASGLMLAASLFQIGYTFVIGSDPPKVNQNYQRTETERKLITVDKCENLR